MWALESSELRVNPHGGWAGSPVKPQLLCGPVRALLDKRLVFVTGKGGVGKSTVAAALGMVGARRGLRTVVAELSAQDRVQRLFEHGGEHFVEVELAPGLFTISVDPDHAMDEYLRVKAGGVGHMLGSSRLFHAFTMATPGMRELLSIGKVWELSQAQRRTEGADPYDLVIVDAPATGHGVGLLRTPRTFSEIARVGPIAHQGRQIAKTIADRKFTGVVAVATPEEMPVNEILSLHESLAQDGLELDLAVLNALYPVRFDDGEVEQLAAALRRARSPLSRSALGAALSEHARAETQREQEGRLRGQLDGRLVALPYLFVDHVGPEEVEELADALEVELGGVDGSGAEGSPL
jgi:anion-transporting  ArsA/GET3 family ATPase